MRRPAGSGAANECFLTLLGSAVTWPLVSYAQEPQRMRRVGVLMHTAADDPDGQTRLAAFLQGLQEAGWAVGRMSASIPAGRPLMRTAFVVMPQN